MTCDRHIMQRRIKAFCYCGTDWQNKKALFKNAEVSKDEKDHLEKW